MPALAPYLSESDFFVDAFTGGGSVSLWYAENFPGATIALNDLDPELTSFWKAISQESSRLSETVRERPIPTIGKFYELQHAKPRSDLERAYRYLFLNRTSFSGMGKSPIGGRTQTSKYTVACRWNAQRLSKQVDDVGKLLSKRTLVYTCSAWDLPRKKSALYYLDPPYYHQGEGIYRYGLAPDEHALLRNWLKRLSKWVLSYDDCREIRKLYREAQIDKILHRYSLSNKRPIKELVITPHG